MLTPSSKAGTIKTPHPWGVSLRGETRKSGESYEAKIQRHRHDLFRLFGPCGEGGAQAGGHPLRRREPDDQFNDGGL